MSQGSIPVSTSLARPTRIVGPSEEWIARIASGVPAAPLAEWTDLIGDEPAGAAVALVDGGRATIGYGLVDRENGVVRLLPCEPGEEWDAGFFRRRVGAAWDARQRLGLVNPKSAYRLLNGEGDGLPGFQADVFAGHVIVHSLAEALTRYLGPIASALEGKPRLASVTGKTRPAGETPKGQVPTIPLSPEVPPRRVVVEEHGLAYEVHPLGGINSGLFCDMREARRTLAGWARGRHVLNTFSYTGSFSVLAAAAGARTVTSVDFASGVLEWSKTNFRLNNIDPEDRRFRFARADVFDFLKEARRKRRSYDLVILDPPAATGVPGRRWFLKSDYERLIAHALGVIEPGGILLVAASSLASRPERLETQIRAAARERRRRLVMLESFGLPADFPTQLAHPASRYLKGFWLRVDR